jgi:hypothetical protein
LIIFVRNVRINEYRRAMGTISLGTTISVNNRIIAFIEVSESACTKLKKTEDEIIDIVVRQYAHAQLDPINEVKAATDDLYFLRRIKYRDEGIIEIYFKVQIKNSILIVLDAYFVNP